MKLLTRILVLFVIVSCKTDYSSFKQFITGYWEIDQVYQNGDLIKSYKVSSQIDYFMLNQSNEGFRKKLMPALDGSFKTSDHSSPFEVEIQDKGLALKYSGPEGSRIEWVTKASNNSLVIQNDQGFEYHYKKFEPLDLVKDE